MSNVNRIFLIGRLTADPELRYVSEGLPLAKFTLAVDRPKRNDGASMADFISVVTWRSLAEICGKYLKKGRLIYIGGRIQIRKYQTTQNETRFVTEVLANEMKMLDKGSGQEQEHFKKDDFSSEPAHPVGEDPGFSESSVPFGEPLGEAVAVEDDIPF